MKSEKDKYAMSESDQQSEGAKRILENVGVDRLSKETERTYREFVESVNRAKEADMERAMASRA
jgi:hypothetical protein